MEFEYTNSFYVSENDLNEMVRLCKEEHMSPQDALNYVSEGWDDVDFYGVGAVENQIIAEINKRLL